MSSYTVVSGDTFDSISRKSYGLESGAAAIRAANPGASEPLTAGTALTIPPQPYAPANPVTLADQAAPDEVALLLGGERFRFWEGVRITRSLDSIDTIEFSAPFDPDDRAQRAQFRPFAYQGAVFTVGGEPLFTGTVITTTPELTPSARTVRLAGYALPGVLDDCTPSSQSELEFNGATLVDVTASLAVPFGLAIQFLADPGAPFERVACKKTQNVLPFLVELAKQRGGVFRSSPEGALQFVNDSPADVPDAVLQEGLSPLVEVLPAFDGQQYFSEVTGVERVGTDTAGSQFTAKNERVTTVRPFTFAVDDAIKGDVSVATNAKLGRMFGGAIRYSITVATWRTPSGELWAPDQTISLLAPSAMVYSPYKFKVRAVTFSATKTERTATLELVLPGAFRGIAPESLPWD